MGAIRFQNECGISVSGFIVLLTFYLNSMFVEFDDRLYIQKKGVCIGSVIAPILSDLVLVRHSRALDLALEDSAALKVFHFVDDFLVLYKVSEKEQGATLTT